LKPRPDRRVARGPADPGLEPGQVKKKWEKEKPGVTRLTRSKTRLQPVAFCFFLLKQRRFDLKKNN
jgi:hypothetical protein